MTLRADSRTPMGSRGDENGMKDTDSYPEGFVHPAVRYWLYVIAALIVAMVLVGGATRLTDSGLSITEWKPVTGVVPPLSLEDWQAEFTKYQATPEYQKINKGMSLAAFKTIYWWEWGHRFLGRLIGVLFAVPLLFFWLSGWLNSRPLRNRLLFVLFLGALQGGLGWFMVMSGLSGRVDVSQYRLAAHLGLATLIFGYVLWLAWTIGSKEEVVHGPPSPSRLLAGLIAVLVFVQICLGGLVAGLKAGWTYNTWPLMDGALFPDGLYAYQPRWLSVFEDILTVQFNHRMTAYLLAVVVLVHMVRMIRHDLAGKSLYLLVGAILVQIGLGIVTLLMAVPLHLGLAHQFAAMMVFAISLYHLHAIIRQDEHTFHSFSY